MEIVMPKFKNLIFVGAVVFAASFSISTNYTSLQADTLVIKDTGQFYSSQKPKKGMTKAQVRRKYGEPIQTYSAVGQPPITRWKFSDFTVYFEHNHVIHAVNNTRARNR